MILIFHITTALKQALPVEIIKKCFIIKMALFKLTPWLKWVSREKKRSEVIIGGSFLNFLSCLSPGARGDRPHMGWKPSSKTDLRSRLEGKDINPSAKTWHHVKQVTLWWKNLERNENQRKFPGPTTSCGLTHSIQSRFAPIEMPLNIYDDHLY